MKILIHDFAGHPFQTSLSRELAQRGHDVIHAFFAGDQGPKGDLSTRASDGENLRFKALNIRDSYDKASLIRRRLADVAYGKIVAKLIEREKPDLVLSGNTPTEVQSYVVRACKRKSTAFVYWVQDFYSVAASSLLKRRLGAIGALIGSYYKILEQSQMRSSDAIVTITEDFEALSIRWGGCRDKVTTIENWGLANEIRPEPKENTWCSSHGLDDTFNFLYCGTLALKHNPLMIIELARAMRGRARVVVVGTGVGVEVLKRYKSAESLDNLMIFPLQPFEELKNVLATADVAVALIEPQAGSYSVPSKVQSYMCSARPVLLAAPKTNLASKVINREKAGLVVDPGDLHGFIEAAKQMLEDFETRAQFGKNGRTYAERTFDVSVVTDRFMDVFSKAIQRRAAALRSSIHEP